MEHYIIEKFDSVRQSKSVWRQQGTIELFVTAVKQVQSMTCSQLIAVLTNDKCRNLA